MLSRYQRTVDKSVTQMRLAAYKFMKTFNHHKVVAEAGSNLLECILLISDLMNGDDGDDVCVWYVLVEWCSSVRCCSDWPLSLSSLMH